ncbi:NAD-dependent epimerase/dehydratase family protein [Fundicoccus culcitae]|uniref:NAD-dependent epimerase/dehydratase family protein n=1 Tax=Fundicoccus culcitae TaxID=2969821 RepID=A0ABY5P927_9LACT|nr:NAD-dependent epimerase/dehydratase family protein [Fundicoccus culcitae]UUX35247.1 NAD-dependent epimerase/dehydratase family protein [Fundicoccus culcitae]
MKKILITGVNSYVGNAVDRWLKQSNSDKYQIDKISVRSNDWKLLNFSIYDSIVHVAGIAHVSTNPNMEKEYYRVNRDLTIELAKKAKQDSVRQFIFLSSIIIYGSKVELITTDTQPNPDDFYGRSKLEAEESLLKLVDESFKIAIIRPPMIYGKNSKGNYPRLAKLAKWTPIFPNYPNERSMIHIDNLTEFIRLLIDIEDSGIFFPQNIEYVNTSHLVRTIAEVSGKRIWLTKMFNGIIRKLMNVTVINKMFSDLKYVNSLSEYKQSYQVNSFRESIELTEKS